MDHHNEWPAVVGHNSTWASPCLPVCLLRFETLGTWSLAARLPRTSATNTEHCADATNTGPLGQDIWITYTLTDSTVRYTI
jgi:hypothetical protein